MPYFYTLFAVRALYLCVTSHHLLSGVCNSDQPPGAHPHQAAVPETVVQRAYRLHPLSGGDGGLAVSVEGFGAHSASGCALLSNVLVQL